MYGGVVAQAFLYPPSIGLVSDLRRLALARKLDETQGDPNPVPRPEPSPPFEARPNG